jgi:hypothetical protein
MPSRLVKTVIIGSFSPCGKHLQPAHSFALPGFPPAGPLSNKNIKIKWCNAKLWSKKNFIFSQCDVNHCVLIEL